MQPGFFIEQRDNQYCPFKISKSTLSAGGLVVCFLECHPANFVVFRSLRLPLNIFVFDFYQSLREARMIKIEYENV
jgi:hypothetical protein